MIKLIHIKILYYCQYHIHISYTYTKLLNLAANNPTYGIQKQATLINHPTSLP